MSSPPENMEIDVQKFFKTYLDTSSSITAGDCHQTYYQRVMPEIYDWKFNPKYTKIELRGSIMDGTNTDEVEEPEEETPEAELQYFDPKDLDI